MYDIGKGVRAMGGNSALQSTKSMSENKVSENTAMPKKRTYD